MVTYLDTIYEKKFLSSGTKKTKTIALNKLRSHVYQWRDSLIVMFINSVESIRNVHNLLCIVLFLKHLNCSPTVPTCYWLKLQIWKSIIQVFGKWNYNWLNFSKQIIVHLVHFWLDWDVYFFIYYLFNIKDSYLKVPNLFSCI